MSDIPNYSSLSQNIYKQSSKYLIEANVVSTELWFLILRQQNYKFLIVVIVTLLINFKSFMEIIILFHLNRLSNWKIKRSKNGLNLKLKQSSKNIPYFLSKKKSFNNSGLIISSGSEKNI